MSDDVVPPVADDHDAAVVRDHGITFAIPVRPLALGVFLGVFLGLVCFTVVSGVLGYFFMDDYTEAMTEELEKSFEESFGGAGAGIGGPFPLPTDISGLAGCTGDQLPLGPNGECYGPIPTPGARP